LLEVRDESWTSITCFLGTRGLSNGLEDKRDAMKVDDLKALTNDAAGNLGPKSSYNNS
jgi:hypothetical protein